MSGIRFPPPSLSSHSAPSVRPHLADSGRRWGSELADGSSVTHRCSSRLLRLIADLQVPAVWVLDVEALEVFAHHVGPRVQATFLELCLHLVRVPRLHAP